MLFDYVQIKDRYDPRSKHQRKSKRSKHQQSWGLWGGGGALRLSAEILRGQIPLRKLLGYKKSIWIGLKSDLNAAKIITAQDYKRTKN